MRNVIHAIFYCALISGQHQTVLAGNSGCLSSASNSSSEITKSTEKARMAQPHFINFGEAGYGNTISKSLKLTTNRGSDLRLERVEAAGHYITANFSAKENDTCREFIIETILKPDAPTGHFSETMILYTNSHAMPTIEVPVYGNIVGKIRVKPQVVLFGVIEKGSRSFNKFDISSIDRKPFNILEITANPAFLSAEVTKIKSGSEYEITCRVEESAPSGKVMEEIRIRTNDANQSLIQIPVHGYIAPKISQRAPNNERSSLTSGGQTSKHIYITRPPVEEDTYLSAWLIKRFLDPAAEFVFAPIGSFVPRGAGCIFDLPSPYARWTRANRRCTSEQVLLEVKEVDLPVRKMVDFVRKLEMGAWLVTPASEAGRLRSTILEMTQGVDDPQSRLDRILVYLDDIYTSGGYVPY